MVAKMIESELLKKKFAELYSAEPRFFCAPGRVNLIGEHTDYNGGFVLPMAINRATMCAAAARTDQKICVYSLNLEENFTFELDQPEQKLRGDWHDYVEGVARVLQQNSFNLTGANILILSDVPSGAGLSSSAALEISVGLALTEIAGQTIDKTKLALICQQAEHEYVGAKVGIMDQFVSANAVKGCALLLDCRTLEFENVPFNTEDLVIVICDTKVKHELASSEYNIRRRECEEGVAVLKKFLPEISQLRDVSPAEFSRYKNELPEVIRRRCRHIITENVRTLCAAECLKKNDFEKFGKLMDESHRSMRDDYEISAKELDIMVEIANSCAGVLGARMTGGGFGGSTVNLVKREFLEAFTETITTEYRKRTSIEPTILISAAAGGASEVLYNKPEVK